MYKEVKMPYLFRRRKLTLKSIEFLEGMTARISVECDHAPALVIRVPMRSDIANKLMSYILTTSKPARETV